AVGLRRLQAGGGVDHEEIVVHEIPLVELNSWLDNRTAEGLMIDPKIFAGLWMARSGMTNDQARTSKE
ncbi:MAG TPA: hypothetical protein VHX65_02640, partial [Pirellulales bacterium]|nr:hypothetical protein [Pirellulales bacterium]